MLFEEICTHELVNGPYAVWEFSGTEVFMHGDRASIPCVVIVEDDRPAVVHLWLKVNETIHHRFVPVTVDAEQRNISDRQDRSSILDTIP